MQTYSPFSRTIRDLQTADLETLKQTSEGWYIEYKREIPNASAVAKSLSAFANTYGGWLFIGIEEESKENAVAGAFPGVAQDEIGAALQRVRKSAADLLNPSPHFETKVLMGPDSTVGLLESRAVICVWVPRSTTAPHVHKSGNIYRRVSDASEPKPENDRFVLDQLWQRGDDIRRRRKEWYDRDPEFSETEKLQPYARVMLIADRWAERNVWIEAEDDEIRAILGTTGGVSSIPFDTVYTSSEGFVARQLNSNDPHNLTLTWRLRRSLISDVIIPLPFYHPQRLTGLTIDLNGYSNVEKFIRILDKYKSSKIRVVDLNFLFNILIGVAEIQKRLCTLAGWSEAYYMKVKVLNAWRTIPFVDVSAILDVFDKHGLPMCLDSVASMPPGAGPENFIEVSVFDEIESENARALVQASVMFTALALAFGIPPWIPHDEESTVTPYHVALHEAGRRAIDVVQPLRNDRFKGQA
jgi:hypothetical protein